MWTEEVLSLTETCWRETEITKHKIDPSFAGFLFRDIQHSSPIKLSSLNSEAEFLLPIKTGNADRIAPCVCVISTLYRVEHPCRHRYSNCFLSVTLHNLRRRILCISHNISTATSCSNFKRKCNKNEAICVMRDTKGGRRCYLDREDKSLR